MVLTKPHAPLELQEVDKPIPGPHQVLIRVSVCGICRTDLHIIDGELEAPTLPLIPGHQIVGTVEATGSEVTKLPVGTRVGVPWLGGSCGTCEYCKANKENLCTHALYTGYQINGGFAEYCVTDHRFTFPIPAHYPDLQAAPLLCAGLIGFRALRMTGKAQKIGFYGFGSSAHILIQVMTHRDGEVYAFTKPGDIKGQEFAKSLGATWAGNSEEVPPSTLDAAIIFAPDGNLIPTALKAVKKGGTVVCAGIHMSDIPSFPYSLLWNEKTLCSVANLTRKDGEDFLKLAPSIPIETEVSAYPLEKANEALDDLRMGRVNGAAALEINP